MPLASLLIGGHLDSKRGVGDETAAIRHAEEQFVLPSVASERKCLCYANYKDIWKVNKVYLNRAGQPQARFGNILPQITTGDERYGGKKSKLCTYVFIRISSLSTSWGNISKNHSQNTRIFSYEYIFPYKLSFRRAPCTPASPFRLLQQPCKPHSESFPFRINIPRNGISNHFMCCRKLSSLSCASIWT